MFVLDEAGWFPKLGGDLVLIPNHELQAFLHNRQSNPHGWLGMHPTEWQGTKGVVVRAFVRGAVKCSVVDLESAGAPVHPMTQLAREGFYEVFLPGRDQVFRYQLRYDTAWGDIHQVHNAYSFLPTLSPQDLYLFNEGNEHRVYEKLGAHLRTLGDVPGVAFAVWAPAASRVSLVGNFNGWDPRYHPMRPLGNSGVWELFVPGLAEGEIYKFAVWDQQGHMRLKTDPYGTYFEAPPNNAAIVCSTSRHSWGDGAWIEQRKAQAGKPDRPMSIYEVHLGSWRRRAEDANRMLTYRELAPLLADYVVEMGFTHVELMPVAEHPFTGSWGYQVTGYFAPTHRHGTPEDFQWFVDHLHQRGIGVILDWVPAHFPRDSFALAEFDGTHLYEHSDPRQGAHQDWGTLIFNYGRHEVRCFLTASALAWLDRYHIDGLRVDAVASMLYLDYSRAEGQWIPNRYGGRENLEAAAFLRHVNGLIHHYHPGAVMIAEESTAFPGVTKPLTEGGLGFDYKWNMGLMHDTLAYMQKDPVHRKWMHDKLTFGMLYQYTENFVTVYSHDEVVHMKGSLLAKMGAGAPADKAANLRAFYAYIWLYPGKKLLFMGGEFAQSAEWNHEHSLDWHLCKYQEHEGVRLLVRDLNKLYAGEAGLGSNDFNPGTFRWVNCHDADNSVISFLRHDEAAGKAWLVVSNFTPVTRARYRVGVPQRGYWREVINTNSSYYGGTGVGNHGGRQAEEQMADGFAQSVSLTLPGFSTVVFHWSRR
ncbi:MAG TPA: 1,4-alpha-glucan branching protein GlgB [Opitutaceae bacterium]|nr:1,4-alpha-glucan branching protein GlgB [Opitutaceae bacterium]